MKKKAPDDGQRCGNCVHFKELSEAKDEVKWGICRFFPRQWYWDGEDAVCDYPQQDPDEDVCGHWKGKQ